VPKDASVLLEVDGFEVAISNPGKLFFEQPGITKLDLVNYYLAVAPGALRGVMGRPMALNRFPRVGRQTKWWSPTAQRWPG